MTNDQLMSVEDPFKKYDFCLVKYRKSCVLVCVCVRGEREMKRAMRRDLGQPLREEKSSYSLWLSLLMCSVYNGLV